MIKNWRILVANRGEIAVRIIKACKELGIETVITVSEADRNSLPARLANRAICIGPARSIDSYLRVDTIIAAALGTGCNAIHPGYGFLCEQPELAEACAVNGLIFIGPTADNIRKMGDKDLARKIAKECGAPVIPGSEVVQNCQDAAAAAEKIGYPVLLKAAAGGGGHGILIVRTANELKSCFDVSSAESHAAFGDDRLYVEHFFSDVRHIEVQVLGDQFGNIIHAGERDCSIQRRYQKIIEESPSPVVSGELRRDITRTALDIAHHISYESAGTVEFILDLQTRKFYFMEMNTRIQVEHPVTEMVTGLDLIQEQIKIGAKEPLRFSQSSLQFTGHSLECRINAEDPKDGFRPCPGRITEWLSPKGPGIRLDSHCHSGYFVQPYYDSLIAKVITAGHDRQEALTRMKYALANFTVSGIETNIPFHREVLNHPDFINGRVNTRWIEDCFMPSYSPKGSRNERN